MNYFSRYNSTTGEFTVPPGGDGLYFFYMNLRLSDQESAYFRIMKNAAEACRAVTDFDNAGVNDFGMISCGTLDLVAEGNNLSSFVIVVPSRRTLIISGFKRAPGTCYLPSWFNLYHFPAVFRKN